MSKLKKVNWVNVLGFFVAGLLCVGFIWALLWPSDDSADVRRADISQQLLQMVYVGQTQYENKYGEYSEDVTDLNEFVPELQQLLVRSGEDAPRLDISAGEDGHSFLAQAHYQQMFAHQAVFMLQKLDAQPINKTCNAEAGCEDGQWAIITSDGER